MSNVGGTEILHIVYSMHRFVYLFCLRLDGWIGPLVLRSRSMVGTIGSLGHDRGWTCSGSGYPFENSNSKNRGTGKVQISTRQAAG